ncbi:hypothetical protein PHYBOEH_006321 [Phytophthora boehmeriae]|uniref:Fe2OG dioxygenase domain-containing protein n=1 Tax=Phytophthora boehmeriae TaxID=109152 RepID=A0A8T1WHA0_9STRA|nr:hypothetical protein PHYBOEH_006321 [Phytophthora boehmeriae]
MSSHKVKAKRAQGPTEDRKSSNKRAKSTQPIEEFSMSNVVRNVRNAAIEHAHLPAEIATELFENEATISYLTADHASWVYHVPRWYRHVFEHAKQEELLAAWASEEDSHSEASKDEDKEKQFTWSKMFEQAWDAHPQKYESIMMFGKMVKVPRFQMLCGDMGSYRFSGTTYEAHPTFPQALQHAVQHMKRIVPSPATNDSRLSGGLVNWYANGDHYIGPHADDERDMIACSPIVALSLGATRRFVFTKKTSKSAQVDETAVDRLELQVEDGDLLIMGGTAQRTHKHAVPKMARCREPRISITLRCFH